MPVPLSISNISQLYLFDLSGNRLSENVPKVLAPESRLAYVHLSQNEFHDILPWNLGNLSGLDNSYTSQDTLKSYLNGLQLDPIKTCLEEPKLYAMITPPL